MFKRNMLARHLLALALCAALPVLAKAPEPITNRKNVAAALYGATAVVTNADGTTQEAPSLLEGSHSDNAAVSLSGVPSSVEIIFAQPEQINLVRIYPGNLKYAPNPSGECGVAGYTVERFNNGYYHPLVEAKEMPSFAQSGASGDEDYCFEHAFAPVKAERLRLTVTKSGHTGRTASSPDLVPPEKRVSYLRAIEAYSAQRSDDLALWLRDAVTGDFPIPVYQNAETATLLLEGTRLNRLPATLTVAEENGGRVVAVQKVVLKKGPQAIDIPLAGIADGRYVVTIASEDADSPFKGSVQRMLRVDRLEAPKPPEGPVDVADMRVFPVDDFHFETLRNTRLFVPEARPVEVSQRLAHGGGRQDGRAGDFLSQDSQGNFVFRFRETMPDGTVRHAYCHSRDLEHWSPPADTTPTGERPKFVVSPYAPLPEAARPKWGTKTKFADAAIRPYDAAKDGPFELAEVRVQWFPPSLGDLKAKGITPWTTYPLIERDGEWLLLTEKPLYVERFDYSGDALETDIDCNDNFGNQYLTDDGRTLCVGKAGKLRVFPPYTIEYDNLPETKRVMRLYATRDGIHWSYHYFAPPRLSDPNGWQHYGYAVHRVDRDFYVGFLAAYDCERQQIYPEICYSRDGLAWNRLDKPSPFIRNTPEKDSWLYGMIFVEPSPPPYEHGGEYFLGLGACWRRPHFYPSPSDPSKMTGETMRRSFESRNLAQQWPLFKTDMHGSWDELAHSVVACLENTTGFARFRKDGFMAVAPQDDAPAELLSRPFTAAGCALHLNAKGRIAVQLCGEDGQPLEGFAARFDGDDTATRPLVWQNGQTAVPPTPFRVKLTLEPRTELYTLRFGK